MITTKQELISTIQHHIDIYHKPEQEYYFIQIEADAGNGVDYQGFDYLYVNQNFCS